MGSGFYEVGPLRQVAINLFYGWGYNFYRKENQLRSDDLLIRSKVVWLLTTARQSVEKAESAYRRESLPPPSREKPRHDPKAIAGAQSLERLNKALGGLVARINSLPVPENDRMTQRYRQEAATLQRLLECDEQLVGQAELLRSMLDQKTGAWIIENVAAIEEGLGAIDDSLKSRQLILLT